MYNTTMKKCDTTTFLRAWGLKRFWCYESWKLYFRDNVVLNINVVALINWYWIWCAILRKTCAILLPFVEQQRKFGSHTTKWGHHNLENTEYCLPKVEHCIEKIRNVGETTKKSCDTLVFWRGSVWNTWWHYENGKQYSKLQRSVRQKTFISH